MKRIGEYVTGRVLAWIIIVILGAAFGVSRAEAQTCSHSHLVTTDACANEGLATQAVYAAAEAYLQTQPNPSLYKVCTGQLGTTQKTSKVISTTVACTATGLKNYGRTYPAGSTCAARPPSSGSCNSSLGGQCTTSCFDGCTETFSHTNPADDWNVETGPETGYWKQGTWTPSGATCLENDERPDPPEECPAGEKKLTDGTCGKQGECPVGMHETPPLGWCSPDGSCPTGQQKAPDGSCVAEGCGAGNAKKKDGTCGRDENGDGEPDEEEEGNEDGDKASGGESCETPPTCSGSPIMCLQTKIQWRIDCNTRKKQTITGGACASPPVCTGEGCNALEYNQLMMQWRSACVLEKLGQGTPGGGDGEQPEWTKVPGMNQNPGSGETSADTEFFGEGDTIDGSNLDQSGFTGGGSCMGLVSGGSSSELTQGFMARLSSPPAEWCNFIGWIKVIFIAASTIGCIYFLGGKN